MMNVESFSLTQKALKEEVNTLTFLSFPYGGNRRKEGISLEDSGSGLCCALIDEGSICGLVQRSTWGCFAAASLVPQACSAPFRRLPADSAVSLALARLLVREILNTISPDLHSPKRTEASRSRRLKGCLNLLKMFQDRSCCDWHIFLSGHTEV